MGAAEDLSRVYFVSGAALDAGASAGKPNLYLHEAGGGMRFIATLAGADAAQTLFSLSPVNDQPLKHSSQVSPDGQSAVFMSLASPTGYDNADATSGEPNAEVFIYSATANGGAGALRCVSCNPTGARPHGQVLQFEGTPSGLRAAAHIPPAENQIYAPRVISEDGQRVFFNSFDALSQSDVNEVQDVYQWEAPGSGSCTLASGTYSPANGGCVELLSSGQGPDPAEFIDSSASGEDVFFTTAASLADSDTGLIDIYDARVGGGFPPPAPEAPPCEGEACQQPAPPPAPLAPASTQAGPGNPQGKPRPPRRCRKGYHRVRRDGKVRCVKNRKAGGHAGRKGEGR
jgi:hypothetical protein